MISKQVLLLILAAALVALAGCGSSSSTPAAIGVTLKSSASAIDQSQTSTLNATVTNDSGNAGVTFGNPTCSATSCGTVSGATTASATYNAPASVASALTVTLTAASVKDTTKSGQVTITVNPNPTISQPTAAQLTATIGSSYSLSLGSGGTAPFTWTLTSGTLPAGLNLNASANTGSAVIAGTPTSAALNKTVTVKVTDASNQTASLTATFTVPIVIATTSLPQGEVSLAYSSPALAVQGGSGTLKSSNPFSITSGTPATGLTFDQSTGAFAGTPTSSGSPTLSIQVTDSAGATGSKSLPLTVSPQVSINSATLPSATVGVAYSQTLTAANGVSPYSNFVMSSGALANGLTLSSGGVISGKPTCPVANDNPFLATVKDSLNVTSLPQAFDIPISSQALAIVQTSLANATVGTAFSQQLTTTGGNCAAATWSVASGSTLPAWLTLDATGLLHGTPTQPAAAASFTIQATDGTTSPTQALSIAVNSAGVNNAELNGRYAFVLQGFDSTNNLVTMAGSLVADGNGTITGGVEDRYVGSSTLGGAITGFYSVGADNRGTMTITTSQGSVPFNFALGQISSGVAALGHVIESDSVLATGVIKKQDTSVFSTFATTASSFAFGTRGQNASGRTAMAGQGSFNGSGSISGMMDYVNTSQVAASQTVAGSYAVGDTSNGRGSITFTSPAAMQFAFYIVSANEVFLIDSNPNGANDAPTTGRALKQAASFPAPTSGSVSVLSMDARSKNCSVGSRINLGLVQWGAAGSATVSGDDNDCGTAVTSTPGSFNYTVAANGRVLVSIGNNPKVLYMASSTEGFLVGTDTNNVWAGSFELQVGSNFTNSSFSGNYIFGSQPPAASGGDVGVGVVTLDGNRHVSGTNDYNAGGTVTTKTITDTFTVSANGRSVNSDSVSYIISTSKAVMIDNAHSNTPTISVIDK